MSKELPQIPLDELKNKMGENSNKIIDQILVFAEKTGLELNKITNDIKENMISFLERKADISSEYEEGNSTGDDYRYENRVSYRKNTRKIIEYVLKQADGKIENISDQTLISLKKGLESEFTSARP